MSYMAKIDRGADGQDSIDATLDRNDNLLRLPQVIAKTGIGRSEIYKRMKAGSFPQRRKLGPRCVVWVRSEIDQWVREVSRQAEY